MKPKFLITICARGGSKGIPNKNIKILNGKPLLHYTIELAQEFLKSNLGDIQLSTDSQTILNCASELNYYTEYIRPDFLSTDTAGKIDAIRDAWNFAESFNNIVYDYIIDLDVTSPLRNIEDIDSAFNQLYSNPAALNIFSVSPASRNPYFNMVEENTSGFVNLVKDVGEIKSRQMASRVYDMNASFYIFTREFMLGPYFTSITDRSLAYITPHMCFDLDNILDFTIMEIILRENLADFKL